MAEGPERLLMESDAMYLGYAIGSEGSVLSADTWPPEARPKKCVRRWTAEEDASLTALVGQHGADAWAVIAKHFPERTRKQCRERWSNYLDPALKRGPWTQEEERTLIRAHAMYGNRWIEIARLLPGRTDNAVKNYWNCAVRRLAKKGLDPTLIGVNSSSNRSTRARSSSAESASASRKPRAGVGGMCEEDGDMGGDGEGGGGEGTGSPTPQLPSSAGSHPHTPAHDQPQNQLQQHSAIPAGAQWFMAPPTHLTRSNSSPNFPPPHMSPPPTLSYGEQPALECDVARTLASRFGLGMPFPPPSYMTKDGMIPATFYGFPPLPPPAHLTASTALLAAMPPPYPRMDRHMSEMPMCAPGYTYQAPGLVFEPMWQTAPPPPPLLTLISAPQPQNDESPGTGTCHSPRWEGLAIPSDNRLPPPMVMMPPTAAAMMMMDGTGDHIYTDPSNAQPHVC